MRQASLLSFIVLSLLALLFVALYRRRRSERLRFWIAGWSAILVHFVAEFFAPRRPSAYLGSLALSGATLLLANFCFLVALPRNESLRRRLYALCTLSFPVLVLACLLWGGVRRPGLLLPCDLLLQGLVLVPLWRTEHIRWPVAAAGTAVLLASAQWSLLAFFNGREFHAVSALCMEFFALNGLFYAFSSGRRSIGLWTVAAGLFLWAAVFPSVILTFFWWPSASVNPIFWVAPGLAVLLGMLLMLFEDELSLTEQEREQYRSLFHGNPLPMWIFDAESTRLLEVNAAAVRAFGWDAGDLHHLNVENLLAGDGAGPVGILEMNWSLAGPSSAHGTEANLVEARAMVFEAKNGEEIPVEVSLRRVRFHGKDARLLVAKDTTAETRAREELVHLANHDPLTGLPNRLLLRDRMELALAKAARSGAKCAVICVDLDRFKQINDVYGHAAGDSCLREVAARFRQRLRSVDTVARTGGEEFTIILDDISRQEDAESVVNDLLFALGPPHMVDGKPIQLSASMGVALAPEHSGNASDLMVKADKAMYRAKRGGGNRHSVFSMF